MKKNKIAFIIPHGKSEKKIIRSLLNSMGLLTNSLITNVFVPFSDNQEINFQINNFESSITKLKIMDNELVRKQLPTTNQEELLDGYDIVWLIIIDIDEDDQDKFKQNAMIENDCIDQIKFLVSELIGGEFCEGIVQNRILIWNKKSIEKSLKLKAKFEPIPSDEKEKRYLNEQFRKSIKKANTLDEILELFSHTDDESNFKNGIKRLADFLNN